MHSQITLQVSLQWNDFNFFLVHKGHSKSLFGSIIKKTNRTSQTSKLNGCRNLNKRYQIPLTNCLQNTASLCSLSNKFAKILRIQLRRPAIEHIIIISSWHERSRVLGQWLRTSNWSHVIRKPMRMSEGFGGQMNLMESVAFYFYLVVLPSAIFKPLSGPGGGQRK